MSDPVPTLSRKPYTKSYLLTPGPTPIPESVLAIGSMPMVHHRTPAFESLFREVESGLQWLFQTKNEVLILSASGSGAMDAAISNLFKKGDTVLTLNAGKFGERWTKIAQAYGLNPREIKVAPGQSITAAQVEKELAAAPGCKAVLFQASETSTGVKLPVKEICATARKHGAISVVDAITALGVFDLPMDSWGIDVLITGSQKALMTPPGLAFIALSESAWKLADASDLPRFYFDLKRERKAVPKAQTAWTPSISLVQMLHQSLKLIQEEGRDQLFARHALLANATRAAVKALGLELLATDAPSDAVTAVKVPSSITDGKQILKILRDELGVTIVGGQEELEGKIFRLSHLGYCDRFDVVTAIAALELTLSKLGHKVQFGQGVGAALQVFNKG